MSARLPVEEAIARILAAVQAVGDEVVPLPDAVGRVLRESVTAAYSHPAWRNSAMDGYAVHTDDVRGATAIAPVTLPVNGTIAAGDQPPAVVARGTAWRIMTGAPVPDGIDTVIRVEDSDAGLTSVQIHDARDARRNIRPSGEDFLAGQTVLQPDMVLRPPHVGLAAANGRTTLTVVRKPRVAILTSGNELVGVESFADVLAGRRIVNTNGYTLAAAVRDAGGDVVDLGIAPDDPASIADRIRQAPPYDALITCGGISVGAFDYTRDVVHRLGASLEFWRVRMRPGGPFGFGLMHGRPWFGLPGNPVSAVVTFEVFVRPALRRMRGRQDLFRETIDVTLAEAVTTPGGLTHFLRTVVDNAGVATLTGPQGSGLLTSLVSANALLIVPHDVSYLAAGDRARALLLQPRPSPLADSWTF